MQAMRILVDRVQPGVEFYLRHFGFTLKEDWGPIAILERDGFELWVSGPESSAGRVAIDGHAPEPGGSNRLVLGVGNLAKTMADLTAAGVPTVSERVDGPAGSWLVVADPAGNPVELFEARA